MDFQLRQDDAVLVHIENDDNNQVADSSENLQIGLIKYIGYVHGFAMKQYVGIELVESIHNGHNGTINGYQYFECVAGHGIYTQITNIIRKLKVSEVTAKMQDIITLCKSRLQQYVQALSERDQYIEELKNKQRELRQKLTISSPISPSKSNDDDILSPSPSFEDAQITHLAFMPTNSTLSNASVFLENVNKKSFLFPMDKDENNSTNRVVIGSPKIYKRKLRKREQIKFTQKPNNPSPEHTKISDKFKYIEEIETPQTDCSDMDSVDEDDNDGMDGSNNIYSPYSIAVNRDKQPKKRQNKLATVEQSKSYSSPKNTSNININTAFIPPPQQQQQQYTYNHMSYQPIHQVAIPRDSSVGLQRLSTSYSNPHPVVYQKPVRSQRALSNPVTGGHGMINYQHPQQQNVMNINNQQLPPQQFVVLYSMPSNDTVMTNNNNSYYHWMMQ